MARSPADADPRSAAPVSGYHPAVEEYLETILELEESGIPPMRARLVERLGVSAPAVSETVGRLEREGYVTLDDTGSSTSPTTAATTPPRSCAATGSRSACSSTS